MRGWLMSMWKSRITLGERIVWTIGAFTTIVLLIHDLVR